MDIPTEADWSTDSWGLDTLYAREHFFGKSLEEAFELFVEDALCYQEDVMFMPNACFRYYLHAYMDYLWSEQSADAADAANCFFSVVGLRAEDIRDSEPGLRQRVEALLRRLADRQAWYGADEQNYGSFKQRAGECLKKIG